MSEDTYFEIDEPDDWTVTDAIMTKRDNAAKAEPAVKASKNKKTKYKMFLTDCDGVLTDGGMYYSEKGDELKKFNTRDGVAFRLLRENGIITGVITGEDMALNKRRCEKLKIDVLAPGCTQKAATISKLCATYKVDPDEVVFVGDDLADIDALELAGLGCCPADANEKVRSSCKIVTRAKGGEGVIREIVDMILSGQTG